MKSIEINYRTSSGYETLYPQTSSDLVMYNSQTLTQVINQQNSEIAGLQGQVGDSEVGVTIPKVKEYHFGAGSVSGSSTPLIFPAGTIFSLKTYYIYFCFLEVATTQPTVNVGLVYPGGVAIPIFSNTSGLSINYSKIGTGYNIILNSTTFSNQNNLSLNVDVPGSQQYALHCTFQDGALSLKNSMYLELYSGGGVMTYSSLDIRIYYYD